MPEAGLLQPFRGIAGQGPLWQALDRAPEFRLALAIPPGGGWLSLQWDVSLSDAVERPILIYDRQDESGQTYESDALLAGSAFGRQEATVFVPAGTISIRFSPCDRPGPFGFRLREACWISAMEALARGLAIQPFAALHALGAWLIRRPDDFRLLLTEAIGARPLRDYARWKRARSRMPDWSGIDQIGAADLPRLRHCAMGTADHPMLPPNLPGGIMAEWHALPADGEGRVSLARATEGLAARDLCLFVPAGSIVCVEALPALLRAAADHPDAVLFYGDEEIDTSDRGVTGVFRAGFDPLVTFADLAAGAVVALRAGILRQFAEGAPSPASPPGLALHRPLSRRGAAPAGTLLPGLLPWLAAGWPLLAPPAEGAPPSVSILIPTRDRLDLLRACVDSLEPTLPPGTEILIIDNDSERAETHAFLAAFATRPHRRVLPVPGPFNFSRLCNAGAKASTGRVLVFLNNDTTTLARDWLRPLQDYAIRPDCGAIGARLLYPSGRVQHAGIAIGIGGYAGHVDLHAEGDAEGQFGRARRDHSLLAVTGACLAVERQKFDAVGGFDEENLPVDLNDVDLCLRLQEQGFRTIFAADCVLIHHESASRGRKPGSPRYRKEKSYFARRWRALRRADPFFHPALSLMLTRPSLG